MSKFPITLSRFIIEQQAAHPEATGEFSILLDQIGVVGKMISHDLRRAGLNKILGTTGEINIQGEVVKKLDQIANDTFVRIFEHSGLVCVLASEEMEKPLTMVHEGAQYMLLVDPLDGSSNTDVNMPLGAIFSIRRAKPGQRRLVEDELLQKGTEQIAAGYMLYGASTMFVFTVGQGVHGFTLEPSIGEYLLSNENIRIPQKGKVYSVNEGNYRRWPSGTQKYLDYLKGDDKATGRPYSGRYSGCLVADVHRIMLGGGIYLYPGETAKPEGKLRLMYEGNPLALIVEQAGGKASTGTMRILDIEPKALHQRVPLIIGSAEDVSRAEACIQGRA
jgi:fructose-1,6-bisphosphatase I